MKCILYLSLHLQLRQKIRYDYDIFNSNITHSVIPHPNFAFGKNLVYVKSGGQAERVMGDSKIKTSRQNLEQLAGSSEICNQSSDFCDI